MSRIGTRKTDTFTRPTDTTPYTIGDVISATTSNTGTTALRGLQLAEAPGEPFRLTGWSLATNKTDFLPTVRVHLYMVSNPAAAPNNGTALVGDNTPMVQTYDNVPVRVCAFDLPAMVLQHGSGDDLTYASRFEDLDIIVPVARTNEGYTDDSYIYYRYEIVGGSSITPSSAQSFRTRAYALWR